MSTTCSFKQLIAQLLWTLFLRHLQMFIIHFEVHILIYCHLLMSLTLLSLGILHTSKSYSLLLLLSSSPHLKKTQRKNTHCFPCARSHSRKGWSEKLAKAAGDWVWWTSSGSFTFPVTKTLHAVDTSALLPQPSGLAKQSWSQCWWPLSTHLPLPGSNFQPLCLK